MTINLAVCSIRVRIFHQSQGRFNVVRADADLVLLSELEESYTSYLPLEVTPFSRHDDTLLKTAATEKRQKPEPLHDSQLTNWSRRWTVNLVTAGGARRAVSFINKLFSTLNFEKKEEKKRKTYIPNLNSQMFEKHPKVRKNRNLRKKISAPVWDFQLSMSAIYIRSTPRILHLQLERLKVSKKKLKNQNFIFPNVVGDRSLRLQLLRG